MAKYTLLELTQKVLSSLGSDQVNSISDTVEATDVARIVEDVYYTLVTNNDVPEIGTLLKLEALADPNRPNYMKLPATVASITDVQYNKSETGKVEYSDVVYVQPSDFLSRMKGLDSSDSNVESITDFSGVTILCTNDKMPDIWTSFDDEYMVFDSFQSTIDTTLQESKTLVMGVKIPAFLQQDDFIPDIDDNMFPLLLNESKSWAYFELKQQVHQKAEQQGKRQRSFYQGERHRIASAENTCVNYGRPRPS